MSAHTCTVDLAGTCTGPGPCDTSSFGVGNNWVNRAGGLPAYIKAVAHAFRRKGLSESEAIQRAVGVVKNWAEGKGGVTSATRARAAAAVAEWEAMKAKSHSLTASPSKHMHDLADAIVATTDSPTLTFPAETALIRARAKDATFPHKFQAARWTHPNGHPRCKNCGQEQRTSGVCTKPSEKPTAGPATSISMTAAPAPAVDLAEAGHVYHWKHGWIPITPHAALQKAHGSHADAARILHKNGQHDEARGMLRAGVAHHEALGHVKSAERYRKALASAPGGAQARVQIRPGTYQGETGHHIVGSDTRGRRVNVFVGGDRSHAEKAAENIRAGRSAFEAPTTTKTADHFRMSGPELKTRAAAGDSAAQKELDRRAARRTAAGGKAGGHRAGVPFRPADETKQPPHAPPVPQVPKQPTTPKAPEPTHVDPIAQFERENRQIEAGLPGHTITTRQLTSLATGAPTRVLHAQYDANGNRIGAVLARPHGGYRASLHGTHLGDFETRAGAHQALSREHDRGIAEAKRKAAEKAVRDTRQAAANAKKAQAVAAGLKGPGGSTWKAFEFRSDGSRAGDKAASKIKQAFFAGDSTVLIETPLSKEQTKALLEDITAVTDKTGVKGVTFHVPSGDGHFRSRGGITGAYVRMGQRTVFINPKIANGAVTEQFKNSSNFMPANKLTNGRTYTLAHELGHIIDSEHEHTFARTSLGSRQVAFTTPREAITALEREHRDNLSTYGRKNLAESYAEAYAQWIHGGPGSSKVADAYAHRFGWSVPR